MTMAEPVEPHSPYLQRVLRMIREEFDPDFSFSSPGPIPWTKVDRPLAAMRFALLTTAGLHLKGDVPFRVFEERFGDPSFRVMAHGTPPEGIDLEALYVDRMYAREDLEVALPMRALESLHADGLIGPPPARHYSFCGGVIRPLPGLAESVACLEPMLREDGVAGVILLPTCPLCVQNTCILARELEARGFVTVALSLVEELSRTVGAPRTLVVSFPAGAPCGEPGNAAMQKTVLEEALELLETARGPGARKTSRQTWRRPAHE
ncbi:MAG: hypothetical protein AB1486_20550 [Planctomycetota bacterium]